MFQVGCTSARVVFGRYLQGTHRSLRNLSHALSGETARIGCSSGFWGDTSVAAPQLVRAGRIDFLVADYLSEITMSLLTRANQRNPAAGYTPDFLQACLGPLLKEIKTKGIRVISNAGGVNPDACKEQLLKLCEKQGINLDVAVVKGDNLMSKCDEIRATNVTEIDSGCLLPEAVVSMNAYLGAFPIAKALDAGADVVITGRCVDSALVLGPLVHKFGWEKSDLDLLASGSLAGHLIECGAQCTGGIFTDWHKVHDWDKIGFPIVECDSKGKFFVTKPPNTGGLVSVPTVAEQLLYEIGDPSKYILPDVTCDFSQVQLKEIKVDGDDAVFVDGAKGMQPTPYYKVCATYADGYRALAVTLMIGPQAEEKARRTGESILKRTRTMLKQLGMDDYTETKLQVIGSESTYGHNARKDISGSRELFLWLAVKHADQKALEVFSREIAAAGTGMAPGFTYLVGGRPSVSPVLRLFSFLYPKKSLPISVETSGGAFEMSDYPIPTSKSPLEQTDGTSEAPLHAPLSGQCKYRLGELAYLRSGDKGNTANIGVVARKPEFYQLLKEKLTPEVVKNYFHHLLDSDGRVERYELPGICGLNFVLKNSLGGGGVSSLRCDPQGKAYGQMLSDLMIEDAPEFELHF